MNICFDKFCSFCLIGCKSFTGGTLLTAHEDLQLAEVCTVERKVQNKISVSRHVAATLQIDRSTARHGARILTTHVVVPQCRCRGAGGDIRHADNEIASGVCCTATKYISQLNTIAGTKEPRRHFAQPQKCIWSGIAMTLTGHPQC